MGAFVRLLQEAPDLRRGLGTDSSPKPSERPNKPSQSPEMSLQAGLDQLAMLRMQISQLSVQPPTAVAQATTPVDLD